jgi:hypothetical protein
MRPHHLLSIVLSVLIFFNFSFAAPPTPPAAANPAKNTDKNDKVEKADTAPSVESREKDLLSALDYPELQVVPRATDRLSMETQFEKENQTTLFWTIQLSAITTAAAGFLIKGRYKNDTVVSGEPATSTQVRADADFAANAAIGTGAIWLGLTYYMASQEVYATDLAKIRRYKGTDKKSDLLRERLAEETLQKQAQLVRVLSNASVISNAIASLLLVDKSTTANNIYPAVGVLAAFLPWIFKSRYIDNYEKHLEYKRKIYAPIAGFNYLYKKGAAGSYEFQPTLNLTWNF